MLFAMLFKLNVQQDTSASVRSWGHDRDTVMLKKEKEKDLPQTAASKLKAHNSLECHFIQLSIVFTGVIGIAKHLIRKLLAI